MMPASHVPMQHPPSPQNNDHAVVVQPEVGDSEVTVTNTVSPAVQDAIDRIDVTPYTAEDLEESLRELNRKLIWSRSPS